MSSSSGPASTFNHNDKPSDCDAATVAGVAWVDTSSAVESESGPFDPIVRGSELALRQSYNSKDLDAVV